MKPAVDNDRETDVLVAKKPQYKIIAKNGKLPFVLFLVAFVALVAMVARYATGAFSDAQIRSSYTQERKEFDDISTKLSTAKRQASHLLVNCSSSVSDHSLCDELYSQLNEAEKIDISPRDTIDIFEEPIVLVEKEAQEMARINKRAHAVFDTLMSAINSIYDATAKKTAADLDDTLKRARTAADEADQLLGQTDGKVTDNAKRQDVDVLAKSVRDKIGEVENAKKSNERDVSFGVQELSELTQSLRDAMAVLSADYAQWSVQEAQRITESSNNADAGDTNNDQAPPSAPNPDPNSGANEGGIVPPTGELSAEIP